MSKIKIFIAGHKGMVGSAILRLLKKQNVKIILKDRKELNLLNQKQVRDFFIKEKVDQVYLSAAKVGGIYANNIFPAEFIYENLMIQTNVIHNAFLGGVKKLLFFGSSCIYPKNANQPINEKELLTGKLEQTNEPYAIAKISGLKMCESYNRQYGESHGIDYRSIMPTNLYGPGDSYHPKNSHVIPSLINRFHLAKINNKDRVIIWGTGNPKREFLYVDDLAKASIKLMNLNKKVYEKYTSSMCSHINIGSGEEFTIKELAHIIKEITNFEGKIFFDSSQPDGVARKFLDSKKAKFFNIKSKFNLREGLIKTYEYYKKFYKLRNTSHKD